MRSEARVNPSLKVDLAADEGLSYGKVVEVMDMLKQQGVRQLALSVEPR
jgi:biopolymer transport protein ExbD